MLPRTALHAAAAFAFHLAISSCASGGGGGGVTIPAAPSYLSTIDTSYTPPPALADLYQAARAGGAQSSHPLTPDAPLASLAQGIAARIARDAQQRTPSVRVIQALAWRAGVTDPLPAVVVTHMSGHPPLDDFTHAVADTSRDGPFNVVGIATSPLSDGSNIVVATIAQRRVTFTLAVPRRVSVGTRVRVSGQLAEGLHNPEISITHPDGRNEQFPLGEGPEFMGQFPVATRGTYQIELIADAAGGSTVVANFPEYVDVDPPSTPDDVQATRTEDVSTAERELFRLMNEARRAAGRPALQLMPALATVARSHSEDMAQNRFIAHNSPRSGTPSDRIHHANLQSGTVLENVGRGYSSREIQDGLMSSPGHRANMLNERVTHVGVGVALEQGATGGLVVTEDFIEIAAAVDVGAAPDLILQHVNDARARRGAGVLSMRPQFNDVAHSAADRFFHDTHASQQTVVDGANREVARFGLIYRRVAVLAAVVTRPIDAAGLEPLLDPGVGAIGIGVSQGSRPDTPPNAVFVVFVLGYPRQ
jgi:uncharacterized protein YkwD